MPLSPSSPSRSSSFPLPFSLHLTLLSHALASYYTSTSPSLFGNQPYPTPPRSRDEDSDDELDEEEEEGRSTKSLRDRARELKEVARWWFDVKEVRPMDIVQRRVCATVDSFTSHGLILLLHSVSPYRLPLLLPTLLLPLPLAFIPYNRSSLPAQPQTRPPLRHRTLILQLLFSLPPLLLLSLLFSEIQRTTVLYILRLLRSRSSPNRRSSLPHLLLKGTPLPLPPPHDASTCAICVSAAGELELFCPSGGHAYHKRCISRWLKVYSRGRRDEGGGGALVGEEEGRVALIHSSADGNALPLDDQERALISSLLRRDLGLRVERSTTTQQQHYSHPQLFSPSSPLQPNQPTLFLTSPSPLYPTPSNTISSPSSLGILTTSYPPCPTCRSPLVFHFHISPPASSSKSRRTKLGSGFLSIWNEFVSGETMFKERGGMQVGALAVVLVMGWLRERRARRKGVVD